jgi:hypothetical protein
MSHIPMCDHLTQSAPSSTRPSAALCQRVNIVQEQCSKDSVPSDQQPSFIQQQTQHVSYCMVCPLEALTDSGLL